jgi:hypothetical protein
MSARISCSRGVRLASSSSLSARRRAVSRRTARALAIVPAGIRVCPAAAARIDRTISSLRRLEHVTAGTGLDSVDQALIAVVGAEEDDRRGRVAGADQVCGVGSRAVGEVKIDEGHVRRDAFDGSTHLGNRRGDGDDCEVGVIFQQR